jgi:hypothetical protein
LSFDEGEPGYKALKSILDGTVVASTANVLIYATSNRRHLLPEYMKDNLSYTHTDDGEVHPGEVIEEKISLSERFGLWVSFYPFSQDEYLHIVDQWLSSLQVPQNLWAQAHPESLVWALERGSRSGRVAYQFARDYAGQHTKERAVHARAVLKIDYEALLALAQHLPNEIPQRGTVLKAGPTLDAYHDRVGASIDEIDGIGGFGHVDMNSPCVFATLPSPDLARRQG